MSELRIQVTGMHCDGCEGSIGRALARLEPVRAVEADHTTGQVVITYDGQLDRASVAEAIDDAGYQLAEG